MNHNIIKVLVIDDDEEDFFLTKHYLNKIHTSQYEIEWVNEFNIALKKVSEQVHDVYLIDYNLAGRNGIELVNQLIQKGVNAPYIFLTGMANYENDVQAMKAGAVDFLSKQKLNSEALERSIRYAIKQKRTENQLIESNNTKAKLFSIISHDLRSPFNALMQIIDMVEDSQNDLPKEVFASLIDHIKKDSMATYALLQNILGWAQNELDAITFKPQVYALNEIIEPVVEQMLPIANGKDIEIQTHVKKDVSAFFDKNMIVIILRNLISNAIKFTPESGKIEISSYYLENGKDTLVTVRDNGTGMSPETLQNLFRKDIFKSSRGTKNEKGTGLGLKLCNEFVQKNKGEMCAESELNKGSSLCFTLPRNPE